MLLETREQCLRTDQTVYRTLVSGRYSKELEKLLWSDVTVGDL